MNYDVKRLEQLIVAGFGRDKNRAVAFLATAFTEIGVSYGVK